MDTHYAGTPAQVRALGAFIKLLRAADRVTRATGGVIAAAGLTDSRFGVLEALYHLGPLTPGELGRKILKSAGNLTLVLDNLERDGLVERRHAPDRRRRPVALTPRGRELVRRLLPEHVARITAAFRPLTAAEQDTLAALCRKLGRAPEESPEPLPSPRKRGMTSGRKKT